MCLMRMLNDDSISWVLFHSFSESVSDDEPPARAAAVDSSSEDADDDSDDKSDTSEPMGLFEFDHVLCC